MNTILFKCQVITPMFLSGADGKTPDLRPPSIKGSLRFWWRAINGNLSLNDLRKKEGEIFGSSDEGVGRSKVVIKIADLSEIATDECRPLPHSPTKTFRNPTIKEGSSFAISIQSPASISSYIKNLFMLTTLLGGLGKRSRRGFGSVVITNIIENENEVTFNYPIDISGIFSIINSLNPNIYQHKQDKIQIKSLTPLPKYPFIKDIQVGERYAGKTIKGEKMGAMGEILWAIGKASHTKWCGYYKGSASPRFASPIYVSVLRENEDYRPVITTLNSAPPDEIHDNKSQREIASQFKENILNRTVKEG